MVALHPERAHVHETILGTRQRFDVGTHYRRVAMDEGVAAQPTSIGVDVTECAERVIVIITFRAPGSTKLGHTLLVHAIVHVRQMKVSGLEALDASVSFSVSIRSQEERLPVFQ